LVLSTAENRHRFTSFHQSTAIIATSSHASESFSTELSDLQGNFGKNPRIFGDEVWPASHTSWPPGLPLGPF
jgi:hypothetical protein